MDSENQVRGFVNLCLLPGPGLVGLPLGLRLAKALRASVEKVLRSWSSLSDAEGYVHRLAVLVLPALRETTPTLVTVDSAEVMIIQFKYSTMGRMAQRIAIPML